MTQVRCVLVFITMFMGTSMIFAQEDVLVNKAGTKLGTRAAFIANCRKQWAADGTLSIFDREKFCACMVPIVLAAPAVATNNNPKILEIVKLNALLNNSPTAFRELSKCTEPDLSALRLGSLRPEENAAMRRGCEDHLNAQPAMVRSGVDANKLCDCIFTAVAERNLTVGDLNVAMDPNSPLFNEVFLPCSQSALPASSEQRSLPEDISGPEGPTTVPVIPLGQVHKTKIRLAGTDRYFIIDSGAEDCIISRKFSEELKKAGAVDTLEQVPDKEYQFADGRKLMLERCMLRGLELGPFKVDRVIAACIDQDIQYLLGKSFLQKFSEWRIDEVGNTLTLRR